MKKPTKKDITNTSVEELAKIDERKARKRIRDAKYRAAKKAKAQAEKNKKIKAPEKKCCCGHCKSCEPTMSPERRLIKAIFGKDAEPRKITGLERIAFSTIADTRTVIIDTVKKIEAVREAAIHLAFEIAKIVEPTIRELTITRDDTPVTPKTPAKKGKAK